jgi:hypothetical protein
MILGILGIFFGVTIAMSGAKFPTRRATLERCGGTLLIGGVALIAFAFPFV